MTFDGPNLNQCTMLYGGRGWEGEGGGGEGGGGEGTLTSNLLVS